MILHFIRPPHKQATFLSTHELSIRHNQATHKLPYHNIHEHANDGQHDYNRHSGSWNFSIYTDRQSGPFLDSLPPLAYLEYCLDRVLSSISSRRIHRYCGFRAPPPTSPYNTPEVPYKDAPEAYIFFHTFLYGCATLIVGIFCMAGEIDVEMEVALLEVLMVDLAIQGVFIFRHSGLAANDSNSISVQHSLAVYFDLS